jgi:acyl-coenzyme A thioesterase PaaI-like protein
LRAIPPERIDAKRRLADATRTLVERVALLDVADMNAPDVDALAAQVESASSAVAAAPHLGERGGPFNAGDDQALIGMRSGIAGALNPLAPPMVMVRDGDVKRARVVFGQAYEGPPGQVHGGFIAAVFDELLTSAQLASGTGGMTGTITIRMRRPVPIGAEVEMEAEVDRVDGRKIHASGVARIDGEVAVEGEIVCIAPSDPAAFLKQ